MEDDCFNFISETFYFRPTSYYRTLLICYIKINAFTQKVKTLLNKKKKKTVTTVFFYYLSIGFQNL